MTRDKDIPPTYTRKFWAKWDRRNPGDIHLLEHHLADVGACFEALLRQPTIRRRLASAANIGVIDDVTVARLSVFAALHDIGKVNVGFQTQTWDRKYLSGERKIRRAGHTSEVVPLLTGEDHRTGDWFLDALGWFDSFERWDGDSGDTACALFAAAMSHHGEPIDLHSHRSPNPDVWRPFAGLDPEREVRRIARLIQIRFPRAFAPGGNPLPPAPEFQHTFLGLCTLADWIGSNRDFFPFEDAPRDDYMHTAREHAARAMKTIGLDISRQRSAVKREEFPSFDSLFRRDAEAEAMRPNAIQRAAVDVPLDEKLVIIESETGSGKTEAALWRFGRMYEAELVDGLYFALPTRAAARQIHERVNRFARRMFPDGHAPDAVLAVPGYVRAGDLTGRHLPEYRVWWDADADTGRRLWAAESAKRFLAAQVAVGTIDQAMMGALQVRYAHMRAACLARNLLVIDEVHASDPYMRVIIEDLLDAHIGSGGHALLMSATLGSSARRQWLTRDRRQIPNQPLGEAIGTPYPSVSTAAPAPDFEIIAEAGTNNQAKTARLETISDMEEFTPLSNVALKAARAGAKVLIIRNTVAYAIETQMALEKAANGTDAGLTFDCEGVPTLHHSRYAAGDRKLLDRAVERDFGRPRRSGGRIVVSTQTLEQSLDIDADLLITDLAPMDVLLQRIGRLHRHAENERPDEHQTPTCIVLTPVEGDLRPLLSNRREAPNPNGLGPRGYVYPDLRVIELTRRLIMKSEESGSPWRIPAMNRELVEQATHPDQLDKLASEMGEAWVELRNEIEGRIMGDKGIARKNRLNRGVSFLDRDVRFGSDEERIRTRLGDESVEVQFDPPPPSPFDGEDRIDAMPIPARWLGEMTTDETVAPTVEGRKIRFRVGGRNFVYDRLGLRR